MSTVLITGANRGIGLALAKEFKSQNWDVIATCRDPQKATDLNALGVEVHALEVTDAASVAALAKTLNGKTIDALINNAGIAGGDGLSTAKLDLNKFEEALRVNTIAPLRVTQALLPNLERSSDPRIVTISSQMGALSRNSAGYADYRASKAAVNKVMQVLALELSDMCVIVMHPGWVQTDMGGAGAEITPQESARGIYKVVSSLTKKDTGRFIQWNGTDHPW